MSGSMFNHNRKRDTGLLYEFLVRRLGSSMVDGDKQTYQRTLEILRRYYSEGTILAEERELFEVVRGARGLSESSARAILAEVQRAARKMDARKVDIKKSCLIKEINHAFGRGFYSEHRIPDYRLLASIQMVIDACRKPGALQESVAKIQLEEGLVRYMTSKGSYAPPSPPKTEVDALVMRMAAKRFEERYNQALCPAQKALLERYVRFQVDGKQERLEGYMAEEHGRVRKAMLVARQMDEVRKDPVMLQRLDEAEGIARTNEGTSLPLDRRVEELLLLQKLAEEVGSDE